MDLSALATSTKSGDPHPNLAGLSPLSQWVMGWANYLHVNQSVPVTPIEPEQKWLLGSRYADYGLAIGFALLLPFVRNVLTKRVYQPLGLRVLFHKTKADDVKPAAEKLRRWNESCWKLTVFTTFTIFAFIVSYGERWFTDSRYFWVGCTHFPPCNLHVSPGVLLFYALETGFYIQSIHFLMFIEVRRKDFKESMAHHIVTAGLLLYSYSVNFTRIGVMVMMVHDVCDIFLEWAKLARYADRELQANVVFVVFFLSWILFRLIIFPFFIIRSTLLEPVALVAVNYGIDPSPHYQIFNSLLLFLLVLHIYWSWLIFKIIVRSIRKGKTDDIREEDSDDD